MFRCQKSVQYPKEDEVKLLRAVFLCVMLLVWIGCLKSGGKMNDEGRSLRGPVATTRTYNANFDVLWKAVVKACADLKFPISDIKKDSDIISIQDYHFTGSVKAYSEYTLGPIPKKKFGVIRSNVGLAVTEMRVNMNVFVSASTVKINATFTVPYYDSDNNNARMTMIVPTNGVLESKLLDRIQTNIGKSEEPDATCKSSK